MRKIIGQPPLQSAKSRSPKERPDEQERKESGLSKRADKETEPLDSPLSNKLMGYISILEIRMVPVWGREKRSMADDPVRI